MTSSRTTWQRAWPEKHIARRRPDITAVPRLMHGLANGACSGAGAAPAAFSPLGSAGFANRRFEEM